MFEASGHQLFLDFVGVGEPGKRDGDMSLRGIEGEETVDGDPKFSDESQPMGVFGMLIVRS